jgi:hypothetical protein
MPSIALRHLSGEPAHFLVTLSTAHDCSYSSIFTLQEYNFQHLRVKFGRLVVG